MSELFSGVREVGYYGESQSFSISTNTNSLSLGITLQSTGTDTNTGGGSTDTTPPVISGSTITTPTNDNTPDFMISSSEAGTITYGGSCSSSTTSAIAGSITVTFNTLSDGIYDDCTFRVTDSAGNVSNTHTLTTFIVDQTAPAITGTTVASNNESIAVTFSEAVYNTSGGSGALEASDFTLTLSGGTATLASATPSSFSSSSNTYTLGLSLSGTPNGSETITVVPSSSTAIYDAVGNAASTSQSNNTVTLNDKTVPTLSSVSIASNNSTSTLAAVGDNVTLSFTASETISTPVVTFVSGGAAITDTSVTYVNTTGNTWIAVYTTESSDTTGSVTYSIAFSDSAGNAGSAVTSGGGSVTFDKTAPTVTSVSTTADNQSLVSITDNITVTFSEAMEPSYITTSTSDTYCSGSIQVSSANFSSGSCVQMSSAPASSNSNRTFTLDPYDNLTVGSTYLTRVTTGVKDTAGNAMSSQYDNSTGFAIVDLTAPTVSSVSTSADNQSSVAITDNITVTFSEAMDTTYVTTNTDNTSCYGTLGVSSDNFSSCIQMTSSPSSSSDNMTFTLDPSDNLTVGTTYFTRVTTGVKDAAGNALSSQYETSSGFVTLLPAPDNLSASGANNTITLTWNSVSGATSYTLYWDNVSGIDNSDTPITSITNDNYTHSNMYNGSIYYYKVAAVNSSGTGTLSSVASALLSSYVKDSASLSGHTFAITSAAMNWNNAKVQATALGGYLTTVNSKAENDWLTTRFRIQHGAELWIGANDIATSNTWVWDNGTTDNDNGLTDNLSNNAKWADNITRKWVTNEPNGSGDCGQIWPISGHWDDTSCYINRYAIIEFD